MPLFLTNFQKIVYIYHISNVEHFIVFLNLLSIVLTIVFDERVNFGFNASSHCLGRVGMLQKIHSPVEGNLTIAIKQSYRYK